MVAATMKISEYVVGIYNFQTGIAYRSILVKKHCFIAKLISWPWEGAIQHKEFIIYNFITSNSILTATTINEYCRNAYASNILIFNRIHDPIPKLCNTFNMVNWRCICINHSWNNWKHIILFRKKYFLVRYYERCLLVFLIILLCFGLTHISNKLL